MKWTGGRRSTNIEDRRGLGAGTIGGGGIGMLLIVLAVSCITGTNPLSLLQVVEQANPGQAQSAPTGVPSDDPAVKFLEPTAVSGHAGPLPSCGIASCPEGRLRARPR